MAYKPMPVKTYLGYIKVMGWQLIKGGIDWKLLNENGKFIATIKISHSKGTKQEIAAFSVQKTAKEFKERDLAWPPKKR